jgi:hypothetical protein
VALRKSRRVMSCSIPSARAERESSFVRAEDFVFERWSTVLHYTDLLR